jgi:hypothetical protein
MTASGDAVIFFQNVEHHNISYCPTGKLLAVGGAKGSLAFAAVGQDPASPSSCVVSELYAAKLGSGECTVAWQPGRSTLAVSSHKERNKVSIFVDVTGQAKDSSVVPSANSLKRRLAEVFAPAKQRPSDVASSSSSLSKRDSEYEFEGKVEALAWSSDGMQLFVGNSSGGSFFKQIDVARQGAVGGAAATLNYDTDFTFTKDIATSPHDPSCVGAAVGDDKSGRLLIFDVRISTVTPRAEVLFSGPAQSVAFHPQFADTLAVAYRKAAASADTIVAVVDHSMMKPRLEIPSHKGTRVRWRPHGDAHRAWYGVCSGDAVTVWDPFSPHIPVCSAKTPHSKSDAPSVEVTDFVWLNTNTVAYCGKTKHGARTTLPGFIAASTIPNSSRVTWHHSNANAVALVVTPTGTTLVAGEKPVVRDLYASESRATSAPFIPDGDSSAPSRGIFGFFKRKESKPSSESSEAVQYYFSSNQGEVPFEADRRRVARIGTFPRLMEAVQPVGKGFSYISSQPPSLFRRLVDGWDTRYVVARKLRNRRKEDPPRLPSQNAFDEELSSIAEANAQACEAAELGGNDPRGSLWRQMRHIAMVHDEALTLCTAEDILDFCSLNGDFHFAAALYWTVAIWWMERNLLLKPRTACPLLAPDMARRALEWMTSFMKALRAEDLVVASNEALCVYTLLLPEGAENTLQKSSDVGFSKGQTHVYCAQCRKMPLVARYAPDGTLRPGAAICTNCHGRYVHYCAICELPVVGLYAWMKPCGHGGHPDHIEEWLANNTECPQCATRLTPSA